QMAGELGPAHRDADAVAAMGERAHHVPAQKSGAAEHRDQRLDRAFHRHRRARYRKVLALYRACAAANARCPGRGSPGFSFVIRGLDPRIHADKPRARALRDWAARLQLTTTGPLRTYPPRPRWRNW